MQKLVLFFFTFILVLSSCATQNNPENKINIVTSFYPLYEIASKVGGNKVNVKNIVPAGTEPHDYEPSPRDLAALNESDLVIYNGLGLEPWVDKIVLGLENAGIRIINVSTLFNNSLVKDDELFFDPHFWLDPLKYVEEIKAISETIIEIDPMNTDLYKKNSEDFIAQIQDLDKKYADSLIDCTYDTFVTNHAAFAYLAARYNLEMISISGISPDSEPSPKTMAELSDLIESKGIKYILTESLLSPKIAESLASEVGAKTLVLNPLEGLTQEEIKDGKDYVTVMKDNLEILKVALQCE